MRDIVVELVYGHVKEGQGFRRFMRRELDAASRETVLVAVSHNLLTLWRSGKAPWASPRLAGSVARRETAGLTWMPKPGYSAQW
jgi:hypothetical protein